MHLLAFLAPWDRITIPVFRLDTLSRKKTNVASATLLASLTADAAFQLQLLRSICGQTVSLASSLGERGRLIVHAVFKKEKRKNEY